MKRPQDEADSAFEAVQRENAHLRAENERLRALSLTDPLTGLPNRRYAEGQLEAEVARASRYGEPLSLIVIDVDDFKGINDRFGHAQGDVVLCNVANFLRDSLRVSDVAARIGGDEFVAILPETGAAGAAELKRRLEAELEELRRVTAAAQGSDPADCPVRVSMGVASLGGEVVGVSGLMRAADRAMYEAKVVNKAARAGRGVRRIA